MADNPVKQIPGTVTEINTATGEETHNPMAWSVLPPPAGKCQFCATGHEPELPHNAQSLYYQMIFNGMIGRSPTWADAMAHCSDAMREKWRTELKRRAVWSEPPNGEKPIAHHGIEGA